MSVERGIAVVLVGLVLAGIADAQSTDTKASKGVPVKKIEKPATPLKPGVPPPPPEPEKPLTQEQMMANWQKAATPGEAHKFLEGFVGSWTAHVRAQLDPTQPPQESEGTATGQMLLGGRYAQVVHKGTMNGQPFEGIMWTGYDNIAKKYVSTWIDNMGTAMVHYDGTADRNTKRLMMGARYVDPMTLKPVKTLAVTAFVNATTWTYEEFVLGADGKDRLVLTITFKKA